MRRGIDRAPESWVSGPRPRRARNAAFVYSYLAESGCVDCGIKDGRVLEFDHVGEKRFEIAKGFTSYRLDRLLDEMKKCEVVCANCHRRRTAKRAGSWRAILTGLVE